jgi:type I restriction-modification system DNA methylase subunit
MTTSLQLEMGLSAAHRNRYLFSDHYLAHILPNDPRWDRALSDAADFLAWLQDHYASEQDQLPEYNEDQLRDHWFTPILEQLGHVFEREASVPGLDAYAKHPDYVFFPDEAARREAASLQNQDDYTARALAVGEVKRWDTPLGKKRRGGSPSFEDRNPSWQIDYYLRTTNLDWGILSNGRLWRLVHRDTSHRLQITYEVDLVQLLREADPGRLRYFTLFFRQAAFRPDARGRVFLDDALAASNQYAVELEEDLEDNVYRALERLMQGFLDLPTNELGPENLRDVYDNSLYLLYRLLFILYGESRGLLPLDNDQYRTNYSLTSIKGEIADLDYAPAPRTTKYWGYLQNLFHIINGDDAELNRSLGVPRYNGGLFDPQQHPFLEEKQVGDRALVEAIDLVSRRVTDSRREFADYRTLGVRHLGSIYEGLLEYQPRVAEEPVVAVRDGGDERWVGADEAPEGARVIERRAAGEVYLQTDRGERKATGSYYTPQYIVEYIVENAVGPLAEEAVERVKERAKAARTKAARTEAAQSLVDEILDLKVLDPALGSGHFLVEATEFLALALATDPYVETTETAEEDLTYWKRRVVERCIYGVDKNPLAVELAKLSLWLATVAADRPLSFLDHHLKCGDSLIGARVEDLGWAPPPVLSKKAPKQVEQQKAGQINMFEHVLSQMLPTVMGQILEIIREESRDYDTVRAKEATDQAVRRLKAPFEAVGDLWTSGYFGNDFEQGDYDEALGVISRPDTLLGLEPVERAREIADQRRFFHWELAFPEVFYDEHGQRLGEQAGFDAVVGNPPYSFGRDWGQRPEKRYFRTKYASASYQIDLYQLFMELCLELVETSGYASLIVPDTWTQAVYSKRLRQLILTSARLLRITALPSDVFPEATVDTLVYVVQNTEPATTTMTDVRIVKDKISIESVPDYSVPQELFETQQGCVIDFTVSPSLKNLLDKVCTVSQTIEDMFETTRGINAYDKAQGQSTDVIESRAYHASRKKDASFFPELMGEDVGRYQNKWSGDHWIAYGPHLAAPREERFFKQPKLLVRKLLSSGRIVCLIDDEDFYVDQQLYIAIPTRNTVISLWYCCAVVNSRLLSFYYRNSFREKEVLFAQMTVAAFNSLPIRRIDFTTPADERERLVAEGIAETAEWTESAENDSVESVRFSAFSGSPLARWLDDRLSADPQPGRETAGPQSDVVHDLLAHLAERMIAMHQQKQDRTEAFWLDLEGVTDPETFEDLKEHGKWEASLWEAEPCRPFVDEESRSTRHLDESLGWNEACFKRFVKMLAGSVSNLSDFVGVYRTHHPPYDALVRRIDATDRLIDLIVYRLYGLTADEVAVVEGKR